MERCQNMWYLLFHKIHKRMEMYGFVLSTVTTDGLVLKHQFISTHIADFTFIVTFHFYDKLSYLQWRTLENKTTFRKQKPSCLRVQLMDWDKID